MRLKWAAMMALGFVCYHIFLHSRPRFDDDPLSHWDLFLIEWAGFYGNDMGYRFWRDRQ